MTAAVMNGEVVPSPHLTMAANRNEITKLPGTVTLDGVRYYSSSGITVEVMETLVMLPDLVHGASEQIITGRMVEIKFQPTAFTNAGLAKLFTHAAVRMGGSIVGATDKVCDVRTIDGYKRRILNAFVYAEPAMTCKPGQTILGEVTIRGIVPLNADSSLLSNFYAVSAETWNDTGWDRDAEITPGWNVAWSTGDATAWDDIMLSPDGITITPKSELTEDTSSRDGVINVTIQNYGVTAKATALNISEDLVLAARFNNLKNGQKKTSLGRDLVLRATTEDAFITCYNAVLQPQSFGFNPTDAVVGELTWMTAPLVTTGVRGPHLLVTETDPEA